MRLGGENKEARSVRGRVSRGRIGEWEDVGKVRVGVSMRKALLI